MSRTHGVIETSSNLLMDSTIDVKKNSKLLTAVLFTIINIRID